MYHGWSTTKEDFNIGMIRWYDAAWLEILLCMEADINAASSDIIKGYTRHWQIFTGHMEKRETNKYCDICASRKVF
jgi:hypothetical protein